MMEIDHVYIAFLFLSIQKIEYIPSAVPPLTPNLLNLIKTELLNSNS